MGDIYWIKLMLGILDDEKIVLILSMPEGDTLFMIWIGFLTLAGKANNNGGVTLCDGVPYTAEMLSVVFKRPISTINLAIETFIKFRMIENTPEGFLITNWEKHQNSDWLAKIKEQNRLRQSKFRDKQKNINNVTVTQSNATEIELEEDIYIVRFNTFWKAYPRKEKKSDAEKAFKKLRVDDKLLNTMLRAIEARKKTKQWQDKQFIPLPTSWLNGKRWNDEIDSNQVIDSNDRLIVNGDGSFKIA